MGVFRRHNSASVDRLGVAQRSKEARRSKKACLDFAALRVYGAAARSEILRLRALEKDLAARGWKPKELDEFRIDELIKQIESDDSREPLVPLVNAS
jgi:hypothetical protein